VSSGTACFFAIFGLIVNVAIRVMTNRRVGSEAVWFRQVGH
jgi:hypothetical protein